jgi:hypothetical protein
MNAKRKPQQIAASLDSIGARDLAARLIEAFALDEDFEEATAAWVDSQVDFQLAGLRHLIPTTADAENDDQ